MDYPLVSARAASMAAAVRFSTRSFWKICSIPRKDGPGITRADLLVINKIFLAPLVGASLAVMEADTKRQRGSRPYVFANMKTREGLDVIASLIERRGALAA